MKFCWLSLVFVLSGAVVAQEPAQGTHLKWSDEFITEQTSNGSRDVDIVHIFNDGMQVGMLDPRSLPIPDDDIDGECSEGDLDCYPPGVTDGPQIISLSPDEKRLVFSVDVLPDETVKYLLYFDLDSKKIIPLGKVVADEFENFTYGSDANYAYVLASPFIIAFNFKTNSIQEVPPAANVLQGVNLPADIVSLSAVNWLAPNTLSFMFQQKICQNPGANLNDEDPIYFNKPLQVCVYNYDTGTIQVNPASSTLSRVKLAKPHAVDKRESFKR